MNNTLNNTKIPYSKEDMALMEKGFERGYDLPVFENEKEAILVNEDKSKRSAYRKHFRAKNGTMMAAVYRDPVHFKKDGQWKEYDNTLIETESSELGEAYRNKDSNMTVEFAKDLSKKDLVCLKKDGFTLVWGLDKEKRTINKSLFKVAKQADDLKDTKKSAVLCDLKSQADIQAYNKKFTAIKKSVGKGYYAELLPNIDLEYHIQSDHLKENIIVKSKDAVRKDIFSFAMKHPKMKCQLNTNGSVDFMDEKTDEMVYHFVAPCVRDAAGVFSQAVCYELSASKNNQTVLTICLDEDWALDEERVYPLTIDPVTETAKTQNDIDDTFVASLYPDSGELSAYGSFNIGRNYHEGMCRALVKFKQLPKLDPGDIIYKAYLQIWQYEFSAIGDQRFKIVANETDGDWSPATTWNTQPKYINETLDFQEVGPVLNGTTITITPKQFDITRLVRKWYNTGVNHGIMLRGKEEQTRDAVARFFTSNFDFDAAGIPGSSEQYPTGFFYYRNASGLEDYWSFHKQPVSDKGTGYVNDFNGNLVFVHQDARTKGLRLPVSVNHVYNLTNSQKDSRFGHGWMLSAMQRLDGNGSETNPYYYTDGDGTRHYFYDDNGVKKDEDGLGLEYKAIDEGELKHQLTAKNKTIMKFDTWGYLRRTIDPAGNTIAYNYGPNSAGNFLGNIHDAADQVITFYYTEDMSRLDSMTDAEGNATKFEYDANGDLTKIIYSDGHFIEFAYTNHLLTSATRDDGYKISYTYNVDMSVNRVSAIREFKNDTLGQGIKLSYFNGNTTYITVNDAIGDGNIDTSEGNMTYTYQFDNSGRPISVRDPEGNASTYAFFSENLTNNKLSKSGRVQACVQNYVQNPSFEAVDDPWHFYALDEGLVFAVNRVSDMGCMDKRSIYVGKTTEKSMAGVAQNLTLPVKNHPYVLSAYARTEDVVASAGSAENAGAVLMIVKVNSDNTHTIIATSEALTGTTDRMIDEGWVRLQIPFVLDDTTGSDIKIMGGINNGTGKVWFDCFQVEIGSVANKFNFINDPGFEIPGSKGEKSLAYWGGGETSANDGRRAYDNSPDVTNPKDKYGSYCLGVFGEFGKRKSFSQAVNVCGEQGDIFTLSCECASRPVPGKELRIGAAVIYESGDPKWTYFDFNEYMTEWQYTGGIISTDDGIAGSTRKYKAIHIYIFLADQDNYGWFDRIQLTKDNGRSYVYNSNGDLVSAKSNAETSAFSKDKSGNPTMIMTPNGDHFEYSYNDKQELVLAKNMQGVEIFYTYDDFGNPLEVYIEHSRNSAAVVPGRTYYIRQKTSGKYLDVANGTDANATNVQQYEFNGTAGQKWKILEAKDGYIMLQPACSTTRVLDVKGGQNADGTNVEIYDKNDSDAQLFKLKVVSDGTYQILAKCSDDQRCLTNQGSHTENSTNIDIRIINEEHSDQSWYFEPADDEKPLSDDPENNKSFFIRSRMTGQYFDVADAKTDVGTKIMQHPLNRGLNQRFRLEEVANDPGYYSISPISAVTRHLEVGADNVLCLADPSDSDRQKFKFIKKENGNYKIQVKDTNDGRNILGIASGSFAKGAAIDVFKDDNATSQEFILEKLSDQIWQFNNYSEDGNHLVHTIGELHNHIEYEYDDAGRVIKKRERDDDSIQVKETIYIYYPNTDLLKETKVKTDTDQYESVKFEYNDANKVTKIDRNGRDYLFEYDDFGNVSKIYINGDVYLTNTYAEHNGMIRQTEYANGAILKNTYDRFGRVVEHTSNDSNAPVYAFTYDGSGNRVKETESTTGLERLFYYDLSGRMIGFDQSDNQSEDQILRLFFDDMNHIAKLQHKVGNKTVNTEYRYGQKDNPKECPGLPLQVKVDGTDYVSYDYDELMRLKKETYHTETPIEVTYTMQPGTSVETTTTYVQKMTFKDREIAYTYDDFGKIKSITENGQLKATYDYDLQDQLIAEVNYDTGLKTTYHYDAYGNITSRRMSELDNPSATSAQTYGYTFDQLTVFNNKNIVNDKNGNPLTYRDGMSFTWSKGRELKTVKNNGKTIEYEYGVNGLRKRKKVDGAVTDYYLYNNQIMTQISGNDRMDFIYDANGHLIGCQYNDATYFYLHNHQNDVLEIVDNKGDTVVQYTYDTWGKILSVEGSMKDTLGKLNPFRYRGYCYDDETGLYYLNSRYYDPVTGRYLNPDILIGGTDMNVLSYNLFLYGNNDPVNKIDPSGHFWGWLKDTVNKAVDAVKGFVSNVGNAIYSAVESFFDGCERVGTAIGNAYNSFVNSVHDFFYSPADYDAYDATISAVNGSADYAIEYAYTVAEDSFLPMSKFARISKFGPAGIASYGINIANNMYTYDGQDELVANTIDSVGFGVGIAGAVFIASFGAPVLVAGFLGIALGMTIDYYTSKAKNYFLN